MSHISKIELVIQSLTDLKKACRDMGFEFVENQKSYKWYGAWIGGAELPDGVTKECEHAIRVPDAAYEIGVVRRGSNYVLLWDNWQSGGLEAKVGPGAGKLKQAYAVARTRRKARQAGYRVRELVADKRVRLVLQVA